MNEESPADPPTPLPAEPSPAEVRKALRAARLAEIAGRDPELAPAAARRARAIAQQLATQGAVEEDREGLVAVQGVLRTLSESVQAAREVRLDAGQAAFLLERSAL